MATQNENRIEAHRARWYPLKDIPQQVALVNAISDGVRFPVVRAGRRSGKSERFKRFIVKQAMKHPGEKYFAGAPTYGQVKKIFWQDLKQLAFASVLPQKPSESDLIIFFPNGSEIHLIGFDKPERFEGVHWTGGGIDEIANIKADAWNLNISPALDTVDPRRPEYRAWCWLFGVPEGMNQFYDICEQAEAGVNGFRLFHWTSAEILPPDVIEAARDRLSAKQFRQEYEASFETVTGRIYEDYGPANHTHETIQGHELLHWMHDQNFTPLSSAIGVIRDDKLFLLDEIVLESAISRQSAEEFVERYKGHQNKQVYIYGDPHGRAGEKHGHASDYTEIENVLRSAGWKFQRKVKHAAPAIKDRQNAVRARIKNAKGEVRLFVNLKRAEYCHKGLATVQVKAGSTFIEQDSQYQHITTAIGYMVESVWPVNKPVSTSFSVPVR